MKSLTQHIFEKFRATDDMVSGTPKKFFPKTHLDIVRIIYMHDMKNGELDLNDVDISELTDLRDIFRDNGVDYVKKIDISEWDFSNVTNMSKMFMGLTKLKEIIFPYNLDLSNVTGLNSVFKKCKMLKKINIDDWKINSQADTTDMFWGCQEKIIPQWYKDKNSN